MRVVFVCTGNTCRSPMAEAIFRFYAKESGVKADAELTDNVNIVLLFAHFLLKLV